MDERIEPCFDNGGELLDDKVSIIRLLRVFLGAAVGYDEDNTPPTAPASDPSSSSSSSSSRAAAREQAGCALWDMSADEGHATAMCAAGLAAISCKVLGDCADAKARAAARALAAEEDSAEERAADAGEEDYTYSDSTDAGLAATAAAAVTEASGTAMAAGEPLVPPGAQGVERLREVACGLLANVCSHRSLRHQIACSPSLGEELLRAFHDSEDPAPLTELLRLFSAVALTQTAAPSNIDPAAVEKAAAAVAARGSGGEKSAGCEESMAPATEGEAGEAAPEAAVVRAVGLAFGLAQVETMERLAFFLENSLEERLLSWACSLTYSLMYRHGDAVIRPLVDVYRLEESLAALLGSRGTDLAYEKLGGTESGLDVLLRCLEVLSTSEASSLGPSPPGAPGPPAGTAAGAVTATAAEEAVLGGRCPEEVQGSKQQQQQRKRKLRDQEEGEGQRDEEVKAKVRRNVEAAPMTTPISPAISRRGKRGGVIRGLVATLVPWEHSRRIQRAALLVLGNVLGNALEEDSEQCCPLGLKDGEARCAVQSCAVQLNKSLETWDAEADGAWGEESKEEGGGEASGVERLPGTRRKFQEAVNKLLGDNEVDGLGEELKEAAETIKSVLDRFPES